MKKKKPGKVKEPSAVYENWKNHIAINPKIRGGKPVIKGTRVPVEIILGSLAAGMTFKEICRSYLVTTEDIQACLAFSARILQEERFLAIPR